MKRHDTTSGSMPSHALVWGPVEGSGDKAIPRLRPAGIKLLGPQHSRAAPHAPHPRDHRTERIVHSPEVPNRSWTCAHAELIEGQERVPGDGSVLDHMRLPEGDPGWPYAIPAQRPVNNGLARLSPPKDRRAQPVERRSPRIVGGELTTRPQDSRYLLKRRLDHHVMQTPPEKAPSTKPERNGSSSATATTHRSRTPTPACSPRACVQSASPSIGVTAQLSRAPARRNFTAWVPVPPPAGRSGP